jgi:AcrR family transcriptional regulator
VPNKRGAETRERLMAAAFRVATERGPAGLTLDAVAEAAGTSKGGLLYHFATKEELLRAMLEDSLDRFRGAVAERNARRPGASARAYVEASFREPDVSGRWTALLTAMLDNPSLADVWRRRAHEWAEVDKAEGVTIEDAMIARLAADGLWLRELVGASAMSRSLRTRVERRLIELVEPDG